MRDQDMVHACTDEMEKKMLGLIETLRPRVEDLANNYVERHLPDMMRDIKTEVLGSVMRTYASRIAAAAEQWIDNIKKENGNG